MIVYPERTLLSKHPIYAREQLPHRKPEIYFGGPFSESISSQERRQDYSRYRVVECAHVFLRQIDEMRFVEGKWWNKAPADRNERGSR